MTINVHNLNSFNVFQTISCHLRYPLQFCNFGILLTIEDTNFDWGINIVKRGIWVHNKLFNK